MCVFRWLARLWNAVVVPRVEEAIISRLTAKRSATTASSSSSPSSQRPSPSNCGLSAGQQAVVKAALSILVNKAVLLGCPLPRHGVCVGCHRRWRGFIHTFHQSTCWKVQVIQHADFPFPSSPAEIDRYLLEFRGGAFPLSAIGSYKGSGGGGCRKGRDGGKLRRSNTSPRKKGSPALNWSCGGSFRGGKMAAPTQQWCNSGD